MTIMTKGPNRPKLSLPFGKASLTSRAAMARPSPTLCSRELRRIVAEHIG